MQTDPILDINTNKRKGHYLEVINRFATLLLNATTIDDIVWSVAKNAIAQLGYVDCVIYLPDEKGEYLIQRAAHGAKNPIDLDILNPIKIKFGEGIVGTVALNQKGEIIVDTSKDPRYIFDNNMALSEIAVPLIYQNKLIGVIDSEHPEKDFYPPEDLEILTTIASMTATKLVQAKNDEKILEYQDNLEYLVQQKTEELHKTLTELKAQSLEIKDSINYAKRIQKAILRHPAYIKEIFPESFFLYKPKDIIGGDFYLAEIIDDKIVLVTADCTGHGVPGAIISVVCGNALKRAFRKVGVLDAAKVLEQTRTYVIDTFEGSDEDIKDGMDIALCIIDPKTYLLNYAGANICGYYTHDKQLCELKADKQPVGNYINTLPFTNHRVQLTRGDAVYLFSDGLGDQFGGPNGKKFRDKQLKELIQSGSHFSMQLQGDFIGRAFEDWKGDLPQVDDVCVIGVKLI